MRHGRPSQGFVNGKNDNVWKTVMRAEEGDPKQNGAQQRGLTLKTKQEWQDWSWNFIRGQELGEEEQGFPLEL